MVETWDSNHVRTGGMFMMRTLLISDFSFPRKEKLNACDPSLGSFPERYQ